MREAHSCDLEEYGVSEEHIKVCDTYEECNYMHGGGDYIITDKDIELLKAGKVINFSVNLEYGCTLTYEKEGNDGE